MSDVVFKGAIVAGGGGEIVTLDETTFILHPINYIYTYAIIHYLY